MSVIIPINNEWRIELEEYSWAVAKYRPRADMSKKQWEQVTWHRTLRQAAENVRERLLFDSEAYGVDEAINAMSDSTRLIAESIKESGVLDSWNAVKDAMKT